MTNKTQPQQTMREFFARDDVKRLQDVQKSFHWTRPEHRKATARIRELAEQIGAGEFFSDEE